MTSNVIRYGARPEEWDRFAALGVPLLPVVSNPNIPTAPKSTIPASNRGKVPTALNAQGQVVGIKDWPHQRLNADHITKFIGNPDLGFCVVTGRGMVGIDCDVSDATVASEIKTALDIILGRDFPIRHRANSTKFLVPLFVPGNVTKQVITTRAGKIEFLGTGQQFVAAGTHPSGARIEWYWPETGVPALTAEQFAALVEQLITQFAVEPARSIAAGDRNAEVPQVATASSEDAAPRVKALLARIKIPTGEYNDWLRTGMAAHHATAGSEDGFEAWHEWSATQPLYTGEADCRARWDSFGQRTRGAPVTIGALEQLAHIQTGYTVDECGFGAVPDEVAAAAQAVIEEVSEKAADAFPEIPHAAGASAKPAASSGSAKHGLLHPVNVDKSYLHRNYIIKNWLDRNANSLLFGQWNAGKTFVLLDMAACVALGQPWFGARVRQGKVLYLGYEGWAGMRKRLDALKTKYPALNDPKVPFVCAPLLHPLVKAEGRRELGGYLTEFAEMYGSPPDLVIIDPLQNALGGDDSDAGLVAQLATLVNVLMRRQGCAVLRIHHVGHGNKDRARGHSSIPAGVDNEIRVDAETDDGRPGKISATKQRDARKSKFGFKLTEVKLGVDDDGDPATSCIVEEADLMDSGGLTPVQRDVYEIIIKLAGNGKSVDRDRVLDEYRVKFQKPGEDSGKLRKRLHAVLSALAGKTPARIKFDKETIEILELGAVQTFEPEGDEDSD